MPLDKTARKRSADPIQEKLRQNKDLFNKEVSAFITKVINFKKLMNGAPNMFFKQKARITQPIPAEPSNILSTLANDFQELAQRGNSIVQEQLDYAKTHRQKQPKAPGTPTISTPSPATSDLTKQLAAWEQKYELIAEGSNPWSRFLAQRFTRTRGLYEKARSNRIRLDMLRSSIRTYRSLGKLQTNVVKGSKESINEAYRSMQAAWHDWSVVARSFTTFKAMVPAQTIPMLEETQLPEDKEDKEQSLVMPSKAPAALAPTTISDTSKIPPPPSDEAHGPPPGHPIQTTAQAFLKKWLGKKRHELFPQSTSSYRLEIFKLAAEVRKDIDMVMNSLEKELDYQQLGSLISEVNKGMTSLRMLVRSLHLSEKPDPYGGMPF